MHLDRTNFKNREKKLKRHYREQDTLEKILLFLKESSDYESMSLNPIAMMYGFEALKQDLSGFYSFNLEKNGGRIRLIFSIDKEKNIIFLEYISLDHYLDFKKWLRENKKKRKQEVKI